MKRLLLFVILMFLVTPLYAADLFLDDFQHYRHKIRTALGMDTSSTALADTTINDLVREAVYHIIPTTQFRAREFTFATTYKNSKYALDTAIMEIISVEWFEKDSIKTMIYAPRNIWYSLPLKLTSTESEAYSRRASYYDYTDSLIFIYPIPIEADDSIRILASTQLVDTLINHPEVIPIEFRDAVLKYATYLAARSRSHPLTPVFWQEYQESITNTRNAYGRPADTSPAP
jgi:hypothetical protein